MRDTEFYEAILGLSGPWKVTKVELNSAAGRVDVWVEDALALSGAARNAKRRRVYMITAKNVYGAISIRASLRPTFTVDCRE